MQRKRFLSELISSKRILFSVTENRLYHNKSLADILVDLYCPATKTYKSQFYLNWWNMMFHYPTNAAQKIPF